MFECICIYIYTTKENFIVQEERAVVVYRLENNSREDEKQNDALRGRKTWLPFSLGVKDIMNASHGSTKS